MSSRHAAVVSVLLREHGTTFAEDAGITLRDKPSPLWRLLVLSLLLSARIDAGLAVAAARELFRSGYRTPRRMLDATWQDRVDALGRGRYRRYDERTATQLGLLAETVLERYRGDLRRLRDESDGTAEVEEGLQQFTGIGPVGAAIFCREVQGVWPSLSPYADRLALDGAARLGLPRTASGLAGLVEADDLPRLVAGCVRAARDQALADAVLASG